MFCVYAISKGLQVPVVSYEKNIDDIDMRCLPFSTNREQEEIIKLVKVSPPYT